MTNPTPVENKLKDFLRQQFKEAFKVRVTKKSHLIQERVGDHWHTIVSLDPGRVSGLEAIEKTMIEGLITERVEAEFTKLQGQPKAQV